MKRLISILAIMALVSCVSTEDTKQQTGAFMRETMDAMTEYQIVIEGNMLKQKTVIYLEKRTDR